jgi:hypothetical protein
MTGLQEIAINNIVRSAVSIQHDYSAPQYDGVNRYQRLYNKLHRECQNECKRRYRRSQHEKLKINPKWLKCYGGTQ